MRTSVRKEKHMIMLAIVFILIIVLNVGALRWGYDSRDGIDSAEWKRRREWAFSHRQYRD
jgi:hypothetical protein